jgi:hypothetical protein
LSDSNHGCKFERGIAKFELDPKALDKLMLTPQRMPVMDPTSDVRGQRDHVTDGDAIRAEEDDRLCQQGLEAHLLDGTPLDRLVGVEPAQPPIGILGRRYRRVPDLEREFELPGTVDFRQEGKLV